MKEREKECVCVCVCEPIEIDVRRKKVLIAAKSIILQSATPDELAVRRKIKFNKINDF